MVKKQKKKTKKNIKKDSYDHTKTDNFFKKYGLLILIGFGVVGFALDPELWQTMGKNIWVVLPVIGILAFFAMSSGEKKSDGGTTFNGVGLGFIIIILIFAILSAF
jgi:hypothetical protein